MSALGSLIPRESRPWIAVAAVTWVLAAVVPMSPSPAISPGRFEGPVILLGDVVDGRHGPYALGASGLGVLLVDFDRVPRAGRGDRVELVGMISGNPGTATGRPYSAVLSVREIETIQRSTFLLHRAGRAVTTTVERRLQPWDDGRALLAGFLIGDTSRVDEFDVEAMRRAGLAHFVAVSGSNVALFLALLAMAAGPLALGPRRRAIVGLLALPVYVAATRFEPSVMRAAFMAGIALVGRLVDVVLEAWQLLALAVIVLLLLDQRLVSNVGFQLSVAATGGVLLGARWPLGQRWLRPLAVTLGAQLAVAPLLLAHFGAVPLLSPLVNLIAAPLVALATVLAAVGVAGATPLVAPASLLAEAVLMLARGAAPWPQLSGIELCALVSGVFVVIAVPRLRTAAVVTATVAAIVVVGSPTATIATGEVAVLDVGQGDAILISGGDGHFALVDGGPDETLIVTKLREYGVRSLDLVVLTHVHADHATGLTGVFGSFSVGQVWMDIEPHSTAASDAVLAEIENREIPVDAPRPGTRHELGTLTLTVEGPVRRYASPNDQSIVITVHGSVRSMLLSGDIETHAQADLAHLRADVLKVPHQGAATSDPEWLMKVDSDTAVISVGPNMFGHPVDWVLDLLDDDNRVMRTDEVGDVIVSLDRLP